MKYCPLTRRMFLRGMGQFALAIPFLPSLAPQMAQAADGVPMRFAMILGAMGRDMSQWYPSISDSQMQQVNGALVKPLSELSPISYCINSAFNPIKNKISLIRGLDCVSASGMHNSSLATTGSSYPASAANGFGYSIDCVLEESSLFYKTAPFLGALRTAPGGGDFSNWSYTSKYKRGQVISSMNDPMDVYNKIFNPTSVNMTNQRNGRVRGVTDMVLENFKQTMNSRAIAQEDKHRLDNYMTVLSEVHNQLGIPAQTCNRASEPTNLGNNTDIQKAMLKLEVAALACGTTNIVMHAITKSGPSNDPNWHNNAHGSSSNKNPSTGRSYASEYCRWRMDLVAYFLNELNQISEANGKTLLDNTMFIYGNEDGTGSHNHFDLPVLVAGGGGRLQTGYFIDYRHRPLHPLDVYGEMFGGRPYNNLLITAFKTLGLGPSDYQKFGNVGFGQYNNPSSNAGHIYDPFMTSPAKNEALPFLFKG